MRLKFTESIRALMVAAMVLVGVVSAPAQPATVTLTASNAGTCTGTTSACAFFGVQKQASIGVQITGTFVGTVQFEQSIDGTTWTAISMTPSNSTTTVTSATATGLWTGAITGNKFRVRCSAYTSGSIVVSIITTTGRASGGSGAIVAGSVTEAAFSFSDVTTANATSSQHGLLPKMSGNAYDFFRGDGTYGQTMATGTTTTSKPWAFTQTWNDGAVAFTGVSIAVTETADANNSVGLRVSAGAAGSTCLLAVGKAVTCASGLIINTGGNMQFNGTGGFLLAGGSFSLQDAGYYQTSTRTYFHAPTTRDFAIGSNGSSGKEYTIVVGSVPTCSAGCGTSPTLSATNSVGRILLGTTPSATTVVLNFTETMPTAPACYATNETQNVNMVAVASTTQLTLTGAALVAANAISWHCISWQ